MGKNYGKKIEARKNENREVVGNSFADLGKATEVQVDLDLDSIAAAQATVLGFFKDETKALEKYNKQVKRGDDAWSLAGQLYAEHVEYFKAAKNWASIIQAHKAYISRVEAAFNRAFDAPENIKKAKAWINGDPERAKKWDEYRDIQRENYVIEHCAESFAELESAKKEFEACNTRCSELESKIDAAEVAANKAYRAADAAVEAVGMTAKSWVQTKSHFAHRSVKE